MNPKLNQVLFDKGNEFYISLKILDLCTHVKNVEPSLVKDIDGLSKAYMSLFNSIWKASIIFDKIAFNNHLLSTKQIVDMQYAAYARTDIEHFHIIVRSSMDYVINIMSKLIGFKVKDDSFSKFRNNLNDYTHVLGINISDLISDTEWYTNLTKVRNKLVHSGAETKVFFNDGSGTVFEIDLNNGKKGENYIFENYAVNYYSEYLSFLDKLGFLLKQKINPKYDQRKFKISGQGLKVLAFWAKQQSSLQNV